MFSSNSDGVLQVKLFLNLYRQLKYSVFRKIFSSIKIREDDIGHETN